MPVVSKAQNRWAHWAEKQPGRLGEVGRDFVNASHGMKVSKLPERKTAKPAKKRKPVFGALHGAGHYMGDMPE